MAEEGAQGARGHDHQEDGGEQSLGASYVEVLEADATRACELHQEDLGDDIP